MPNQAADKGEMDELSGEWARTSGAVIQQTNQLLQTESIHHGFPTELFLQFESGGVVEFQQTSTSQSPLNEAVRQSNSLQYCSSDGFRQSQQQCNDQLNQAAGRNQTDDQLQCISGGVVQRFGEETSQSQQISQDSQQTKSGSGKTLSEAQKEKRRGYCKKYRERVRERKRAANDQINLLTRERDLFAARCGGSLQESALYSQPKVNLIHHPTCSAPTATLPRDSPASASGEADQTSRDYDMDVISALRLQRDSLAAELQRMKESGSCPQPQPQPAQARGLSTIRPNLDLSAQMNGSQMSNEVQDPRTRISSSEAAVFNELNQEKGPAAATTTPMAELLLNKINANSKSNVDFSDFPDLELEAERVTVGRYSFPKSLRCTVQKIIENYGDVTENSKMPRSVDERTYILLCATIKEMEDQKLEQVTEDMILKWNDTIKDALRINFNAEFAMNHLKNNILPAYIGRVECQEVETMALTISKLEAELNAYREEHAKRCEQSKVYKDVIYKFNGKSLSAGLFKH